GGMMGNTTMDAGWRGRANKAVNRQMEALQAVADVEWGMSSERLLSSSASAYVEMRRRVQPFGYLWKTKSTLIDVFVSESAAYRRAVNSGATPEAAMKQLKGNTEFMTKLRADKTRLQPRCVV